MFAGIVALSLAANACLKALERSNRALLIAATFVVLAIGAYSASFVLDMLMSALLGELPADNVILPGTTWSIVSVCALMVGARRSVPAAVRSLPFLIFGGLAMAATAFHSRNIVTALVLILGGLGYAWASGTVRQSPRAGSDRPSREGLPPSFAIGRYRINAPASSWKDLVELTPGEYKFFARVFKNERTYEAPPATFLGRPWKVMLGTVDGRIYKVAAFVEFDDKPEAERVTSAAMHYCTSQLGKPAEEKPGLVTWDTRDGNVILQTASIMGTVTVNVFVTSSAVRSFARLE